MGCCINSYNQPLLYDLSIEAIEFLPVCNLELEPEVDDIRFVDTFKYIKNKRRLHINKIEICRSNYINGVMVYYIINDREIAVKISGTDASGQRDTLELDSCEHIVFISTSYSTNGIHSIELHTSRGRKLLSVGEFGVGKQNNTVDLQEKGKGIVGVRCGLSGCVFSIGVYVALRIDILSI